ncbi:ABC transporter ATP-binding protein [Lacticaseibacillus mingshuiensis]|uniref:ABC transporter ATP-binding protein n=1 Tax=Lacticaseibacillus mingshuiensis TaxID=2799574 RepID=A0ABW4CMV0_9LACO|nr:ABC transporter ATP-binding protein [Lacticaseibacillus mingshuiensis]
MLEVQGITKHFGDQLAVADESFTIHPGEIMGLIGQNGAGKTTTFRMILGFLRTDAGQILWDGQPVAKMNRDLIGYLPEERGLYPKLSIEEQVAFFGQLHGMRKKEVLDALPEWLERFDVKGKRTDKLKDLSKGNQQKIQLICALIFQPKLLILDEPFSGLDPVNASLLEQGIQLMKKQGAAIIFSSHDMSNVEALSDHLVMLKNGETVLSGTVDDIRNQFGRTRIYLQDPPLDEDQLRALPGVTEVQQHAGHYTLHLSDEAAGRDIFTAVTQNGYIAQFAQAAPTLDEIFRLKAGEPNA